jgi:hypothetical protein
MVPASCRIKVRPDGEVARVTSITAEPEYEVEVEF